MPIPPVWSYALVADNTALPTQVYVEFLSAGVTQGIATLRPGTVAMGLRELVSNASWTGVYDSVRILRIENGLVYFNNAGLDALFGSVADDLEPTTASSELLMEGQVLGEPLGFQGLYEGVSAVNIVSGNDPTVFLTQAEAGYTSAILAGDVAVGVPQVAVADHYDEAVGTTLQFGWPFVATSSKPGTLSWNLDNQAKTIPIFVQKESQEGQLAFGSTLFWFSGVAVPTDETEFHVEALYDDSSTLGATLEMYSFVDNSWGSVWSGDINKIESQPFFVKHYGAFSLKIAFTKGAEGTLNLNWRHMSDPS